MNIKIREQDRMFGAARGAAAIRAIGLPTLWLFLY